MQVLYKGKSSTYVGECECGTVILAEKAEVDFFMYTVKCPMCGDSITVFEDGSGMAKGVRKAYQDKQKESNRHAAGDFLAGLEEIQEKDLKTEFNQLKQILEEYADKENYWDVTWTHIGKYIVNNKSEEIYECTTCKPEPAERGLLLLEELKNN